MEVLPSQATSTPARAVLVLDADQSSALAIVRSLGRRSIEVDVASASHRPLAGLSRHARACWRHPDPLENEGAFIDWLHDHVRDRPYALIIPVTERSVGPLTRHRLRFDPSLLALAPLDALEQVLDKDRTVALAESLGIPVPRSVLVNSPEGLEEAAAGLGYPVVVKPARSVGRDASRRVHLSVSYAQDAGELERQVRAALQFGAVLLQEYFRGDGIGIELIADRGELQYVFQHRRLHEVPLTGGGSSLRISEPPVPALRRASESLMRALVWHGVAMVEFKYASETGEFRLMEINGRFWGSLPLAVAAGADFPVMLHELFVSGRVGVHAPARTGIVGRQLERDLDWLEQVLRRAAPPGLVRLPTATSVLRDSLLAFSPRHHFDVQSWRDPWPGLVDIARIVRRQTRRATSLIGQRLRRRRELQAARSGAEVRARLTGARQVLFLCHGNINRSALAQAYAQQKYPGQVEFVSAGFHAPGGRPADPTMVDVARGRGIDLDPWASRTLTPQMIEQADLILAMELSHLDRLQRDHPGARHKACLLGARSAQAASQVEVPDPYGQPRDVYARVCGQVTAAVDAWFGPGPAQPDGGARA